MGRMGKILLCFIFLGILTSFVYKIGTGKFATNSNSSAGNGLPIILWWTPFTTSTERVKECSLGSCLFSENRNHFYTRDAIALMFYGSDFKIEDLPLPRKKEWWCLLHEESPKNNPILNYRSVLKMFNTTSTFKFYSDMPLTLQYLQSFEHLVSQTFFKDIGIKNKFIAEEKIAPVVYLQSDCDSPSERDEYVKSLSTYINIDSYGTCLNNKALNNTLKGIEAMNHRDILNLISKYKFTLALENYACEDYITEKLWRPLTLGSVPIYWGSSTVHQWLPNPSSIIDIRKFKNPRDLAMHIKLLLNEDLMYSSHLEHKLLKKVLNKKLIEEITMRKWGINEDQLVKDTYVEAYECYVCNKVHEFISNNRTNNLKTNSNQNDCPPPATLMTNAPNLNSEWYKQWHQASVEATVLENILQEGKPFTMDQFYKHVLEAIYAKT